MRSLHPIGTDPGALTTLTAGAPSPDSLGNHPEKLASVNLVRDTGLIMHQNTEALEAGLDHIRQSPKDQGVVEMIVRRPAIGEREVLAEGRLDPAQGLVGDTWKDRPSRLTPDGSPHPEMQLNLMNSRVLELISPDRQRWPLAGDQFYVDIDLSVENLPPGSQLELGTTLIEVTAQPHTGCAKFKERFGADAMRFVNSPEGKELRLRGMNAKVVQSGTVQTDDPIRVRRT